MNPKREYIDFLNDILDSIIKIEQFTENMEYDEFINDEKTSYAVIRALEIIGEATKEIPSEIRENYSELPWKEMVGMRDKLIHVYFGVNLDVVWETIQKDIPSLKSSVIEIIEEEEKKK
jgi:uncharacterized protein with HEPN domain